MAGLDLAHTSVFLDLDGTMTVDTVAHLRERLAPSRSRTTDAERVRDDIGTRAWLLEEWDRLPHDEAALRDALRDVSLDPAAAGLVADLRASGAEVLVVSDGFGLLAAEVAELGVPVLTNTVDWATGRLEFPHEDRCCACSSCGVCKQAPIKDARRRGRSTVLVGDDATDYKAALLADVVFATGPLAEWCARQAVRFVPFSTLAEVRAVLLPGPCGASPGVAAGAR